MWISATRWDELSRALRMGQDDNTILRTTNVQLERANAQLTTTVDWLTTRVNQLEYLAARITEKNEGIPMGAPVIGRPMDFKDILDAQSDLFSDPREEGSTNEA